MAFNRISPAVVIWTTLSLAACSGLPSVAPLDPPPLADALFAPALNVVDVGRVFAFSAPMQQFLESRLRQPRTNVAPERALVDALYARGDLQLRYDDGTTRTAAEAFAERRGNCLTLVLMTASFAKALGMSVDYRWVQADDADEHAWQQSGSLLLHADHVLIVLSAPRPFDRRVASENQGLLVDFLPQSQAASLRSQSVDEARIVAMYYNNRAVEALSEGQIGQAYWWARAAVLQAPAWNDAVNTLAVVYWRAGQLSLAERVLGQLLQRSPDFRSAMTNLQQVQQEQERRALPASG